MDWWVCIPNGVVGNDNRRNTWNSRRGMYLPSSFETLFLSYDTRMQNYCGGNISINFVPYTEINSDWHY